jgi:hypothetical protein
MLPSTCSQFHQRFKRAFFVRKPFWQRFYSYDLAKNALSYKKHARKTLMKLTHGVLNHVVSTHYVSERREHVTSLDQKERSLFFESLSTTLEMTVTLGGSWKISKN